MTDRESRERLIEIIRRAKTEVVCCTSDGEPVTKWQRNIVDRAEAKELADHLIASGVIVPPCKAGDKVYVITLDKTVEERIVRGVMQYADGLFINLIEEKPFYAYDAPLHQIFLTKEEAEAKLKEMKDNG